MPTDNAQDNDELDIAISELMGSASGRVFIYWLISECGLYREPMSTDAAMTSYMLGRQSIGRKILDKFEQINPCFYPELLLLIAKDEEMKRAVNSEDGDENLPEIIE